MTAEYPGATAALAARTFRSPPGEGTLSPTTADKSEGKLALVIAVATLQEASSTPTIGLSKIKQAESTVDQLSDSPLKGIPTHRDHTIVVLVLMWDANPQIKMGLPPISPG